MSLSIVFALGLTALMIGTAIFIVFFYHDSKQEELEQWVDFSFSGETTRRALLYYRLIAVILIFFYICFTFSCLMLQADGYLIFADAKGPIYARPIATAMFALDLVVRGALFDVMQHFDLRISPVSLNRSATWFVWYSFAFRMTFALTLLKILFSFIWIYGKARMARKAQRDVRDNRQMTLFK
jgi:hypothetical protein